MTAPPTTPSSTPGRGLRLVVHPDGLPEGLAGEHVLEADTVVIGRQEGCDLVIAHPTISRRHAELRRGPEGFRIVDLGSANGTWVGGARVSEAAIAPGERFRVGAVWLELLTAAPSRVAGAEPVTTAPPDRPPAAQAPSTPRPELPPAPAAPPAADRKPAAPTPEPARPVEPKPAPPGSQPVPPEARPVTTPSRPTPSEPKPALLEPKPATPEPRPAPPPPSTTTGSHPVRLSGSMALPLDLPVESTGSFRRDLIEAAAAAEVAAEQLEEVFQREGLEEHVGGNTPFVLDGADTVWWVENGRVEVFTVPLDRGRPAGARTHFVTIQGGDLMFGMDLERYAMGNGFLAVGTMGTILRRLSVTRLQELASEPRHAEPIGRLVDGWVANLSRSLTREITPGPVADVTLEPSEDVELANQKTARSNRGVLWIEAVEGNLLYVGMEELVFEAESAEPAAAAHSMLLKLDDLFAAAHQQVGGGTLLFPITPDTWIEATNPGAMATRLVVHTSRDAASDAPLWRGLAVFHQVLCQCEFINKKIAVVDEFNRLKTKAEYSQAARKAALREIAMVLEKPAAAAAAAAVAGDEDPVFVAARLVGEASGMKVVPHPEADRKASYEDRVSQVAKASRFRTRPVALRGEWWKSDHGPLLGRVEGTDIPVALLPKTTKSYVAVNPTTGETQPVTDGVAAALDSFGFVFYPPLPDGPVTGVQLLRLGARGLTRDVWMLVMMGIALGLLGTLTPFFTGKLFDTAIPEADRSLVFQFTIALFIAAVVSSAFKIVQSISVLRIQGKMDYKLQAAVWDRLLDLPSRFFRDYSAGDLADRAAGINTIRGYVAGAGVSSILGSLSSLFYVALMFKYDWKMGLLAMGLTAVFIGFTFACNYLQLTFQRDKLKLQGKITGMVLQLIAGVGKLRVSGAENHAYRIWAHEFSQQRRIEFVIGRIQNAVQVFNAGFPVIANMAIFFTLIWLMEQAAKEGTPGGMSTGDFIAFTSAYGAFQAAMGQLSNASLDLLRVVPVFERLKPIITTEPEIDESKAYPGRLKGGIEVSHVSFRYSEDSPLILKDLSLTIEPGDYVAFVGGSGSGKSTLMRLMLGFEKPTKGSVYYDGQDLATLDVREVRQQIGVVLQNASLAPAELYKNIIGTSSLTIEDAWEAARAAGLAEDIDNMPMGMHTYVSEGGGGLSGGQRQRLIIARALVRKPRILFFDEATSALDNRSQATVTESMDRLQATRIVIAHRLSTIVNAKRICYLKDGKVAEEGSYEELMARKGLFYELAIRQMA